MIGESDDSMTNRVRRLHRIAILGQQTDTRWGLKLSAALLGLAPLAFLFAAARLVILEDVLGLVATFLFGAEACFAGAIIVMRGDRERLRVAVFMALWYNASLILIGTPTILYMYYFL